MMRAALMILTAVVLANCAPRLAATQLEQVEEIVQEQEENRGGLQQIADRIIPANTNEERALRLCGLGTIGVEVLSDRIRLFDPGQAPAAVGHADAIYGAVLTARNVASSVWFNADLANVVMVMTQAFAATGKDRILGAIAGGLSPGNILRSIERAAVTEYKAGAMVRDIKLMIDRLRSGDLTMEDAWEACTGRLRDNVLVMRIMNGSPAELSAFGGVGIPQ